MLRSLVVILFLVVFTEAITEIITKSELFSPIRKFFFDRRQSIISRFIHDLLDCGYCVSVWVGLFSACVFLFVDNIILNLFFMGIVIHRLSNILHYLIDRINRNYDINLE